MLNRNALILAVAAARGFEDKQTVLFATIADNEFESDETVRKAFELAMSAPMCWED